LARISSVSLFLSCKARSITSLGNEHNKDSPIVTSSSLWDLA
jgi:hypothetical protein